MISALATQVFLRVQTLWSGYKSFLLYPVQVPDPQNPWT